MSISPLIPAAGAAGVFAARAAKSLAGGLSFADVFRKADAAQPSAALPAADQTPVPGSKATSSSSDPKKLLSDLQDLLMKRLAAAGIDLSQPVSLHTLGDDKIQIDGENPDWPRIEQLIGNDPELKDSFNRLADVVSRETSTDRRQFKLTLSGGQATISTE